VVVGDDVTDGVSYGDVIDLQDQEFIIVESTPVFANDAVLTAQRDGGGVSKNYTLKVRFVQDQVVIREEHGGKALECYPSGNVEEMFYVPVLKAYEMNDMYDLAMVKFATHKVFLSMRKIDLAKVALEDFAMIIQSFNTGQRGEA
jgi:hypothetical protein